MYLEKPGKIVSRQIDMPRIGKNGVLVKIKAVGICGSDIHYYTTGRIGQFVVKKPLILGHECSGKVVEAGEEVSTFQAGDRVVLEPGIPCRKCSYCKQGRYNLCSEMSFMATPPVDGALVEYVVHPADFSFKIPEETSFEEATFFEPFAVGLYAVERANLKPASKILILGAGPIGLATLLSALSTGHDDITMVDLYEFRLAKAKEMGVRKTVSPHKLDILTKFGPQFDVVFETAGSVITTQETVMLARRGGKVILVGLPGQEKIELNTNLIISKELDLLGIFRYVNIYPRIVKLVQDKKLDFKPLITHKFSFEDTERGLKFVRDNKDSCVKAVIQVCSVF